MSELADAHMHLFSPGYVDVLPESCRRVQPDEVTLYESLRAHAGIKQSLVIGYEGLPAYRGNNDYIAKLSETRPWIRPTAFIADPSTLTVKQLERFAERRFVGLSLYLFDDALLAKMRDLPKEVWQWLVDHRWLISLNSRGPFLNPWQPILGAFPELRLIVSHLGLPPAQDAEISVSQAEGQMTSVLALAKFPRVHLKASGFYALARPSYGYPHKPAWAYLEVAMQRFGAGRLLWGSDFSPVLEHLSFEQTHALLGAMSFLRQPERELILGRNLLKLLTEVAV